MNREILMLAVILIAIYVLYKRIVRIEERLDIFENKMFGNKYLKTKGINERLDEIESLCLPLSLLNIFKEDYACLVKDYRKADEEQIRLVEEVYRIEKQELQSYERTNSAAVTFIPSEYLKKKILDASAATVILKIQYENLQALQQPFIDVLNGKITIQEAQKIMNKKVEKLHWVGEPYDTFHNDPRVRKEFEEFYENLKSRWEKEKWKDRLKWYKEL